MNSSKKIPPKKVLGRGLQALLEDSSRVNATPNHLIKKICIQQITTNPFQPRKQFDIVALQELASSIQQHGIIQPLTVRKINNENYQLIAGERRLKAAKMIGLKQIPVYILIANEQQMLEIALIENIQRENLNSIEIALSYQQLLSTCNMSQETLGIRVGKNRSTINNYLRLLKLPPVIQAALRDQKISMGHARAMISVIEQDRQLAILKKTMQENLSVRQVEELVRIALEKKKKKKAKAEVSIALLSMQKKIAAHLSTKVMINTSDQQRGHIKIVFSSQHDLDRIIQKLSQK